MATSNVVAGSCATFTYASGALRCRPDVPTKTFEYEEPFPPARYDGARTNLTPLKE